MFASLTFFWDSLYIGTTIYDVWALTKTKFLISLSLYPNLIYIFSLYLRSFFLFKQTARFKIFSYILVNRRGIPPLYPSFYYSSSDRYDLTAFLCSFFLNNNFYSCYFSKSYSNFSCVFLLSVSYLAFPSSLSFIRNDFYGTFDGIVLVCLFLGADSNLEGFFVVVLWFVINCVCRFFLTFLFKKLNFLAGYESYVFILCSLIFDSFNRLN